MSSRPRRPWLLIVASLLLAHAVQPSSGRSGRRAACVPERLQAEIKQVYAETEALRTQATRAEQRVDTTRAASSGRLPPAAAAAVAREAEELSRASVAHGSSEAAASPTARPTWLDALGPRRRGAGCSARRVPMAIRRWPGKPTPAPSRTRMTRLEASAARMADGAIADLDQEEIGLGRRRGSAAGFARAARKRGRSARIDARASARDAPCLRGRPRRRPGRADSR